MGGVGGLHQQGGPPSLEPISIHTPFSQSPPPYASPNCLCCTPLFLLSQDKFCYTGGQKWQGHFYRTNSDIPSLTRETSVGKEPIHLQYFHQLKPAIVEIMLNAV